MGAILVAVVLAMLVADYFELAPRFGVKVMGPVPQGLPKFVIPWPRTSDLVPLLQGGLAVAFVSFADTSVLSRAFAARSGSLVHPNGEMIGLGAANLAAGLFQGFPISSSSSRTPVAAAAGAKTQLTGVVGALIVAIIIIALPRLFSHLAYSALAAVVISAAIGLFEFGELRRLFLMQRWEFWLSVLCTVGVAVWGAITGIGIAILLAIAEFLYEGWRPHWAVMGKPDGIDGYHDMQRYPAAARVPGLVIFRWDAPLFFANAEYFSRCVLDAVAESPTPPQRVVVASEPITNVDVTGADAVTGLDQSLAARKIELCFAELKDPVKDKLKRFGLVAQFGEGRFFPTVEAAVGAHRGAAITARGNLEHA